MKPRRALGAALLLLVAALLAACSASTSPSSGVSATPAGQHQDVQVTVHDDWMDLSQATFSAGRPYHFVVTNQGTLPQECMIMPHEMGQMPMGDLRHQALMTTNVMMPGAMQAFDYTFSPAMAPQQVEFTCYSNGRATMSTFMQIR
jgi:hypothetical protein